MTVITYYYITIIIIINYIQSLMWLHQRFLVYLVSLFERYNIAVQRSCSRWIGLQSQTEPAAT